MSALLDAVLGLGSGVLDVLDMPGSYLRGALGGRLGERLSGREMLDEWGVTGENDPNNWFEAGDIAGFGAEMIADPLNLLGLGLAGKTARGAKAARLANEGIAAQNAGIDAANTMSQAMRAKGALPEELLPQAEKIYEYIPQASNPNQLIDVPGPISGVSGMHGHPRTLDELHRQRAAYLPRGVDPVTAPAPMRLEPAMRNIDDDELLDIRDALESYQDWRKWPSEFGQPVRTVNEAIGTLMNEAGTLGHQGFDVKDLERLSSDFRSNMKHLYDSNLKRIEMDELNPNLGMMGDGTPTDLYGEILQRPNDPLYPYLKGEEDLRKIGQGLIREMNQSMAPMPEAFQSFYAIPGKQHIDRELYEALTSDRFPATLLQSIEGNLGGLGKAYPETHGIGSPYFTNNMQGARGFLGDEITDRLIAQLTEGRTIPGLYSDVFAGGQTFLPYVAPKLQDLLPMRDVPKMPSRLLAALMGYNVAQTAGGY